MQGKIIKLIAVLIGLCVLAPIICNIIVGTNNVFPVKVVGSSVDWLIFYGNYIGAALGALSSFVILYFTIKDTNERFTKQLVHSHALQEGQLRHQELLFMQKDIADRFTNYSIASDINIIERLDIKDEQEILSTISHFEKVKEKYSGFAYSATILYNDTKSQSEQNFVASYLMLMNSTCQLLDEMILKCSRLIGKKEAVITNIEKEELVQKIQNLTLQNATVLSKALAFLQEQTKEFQSYNEQINL